jgi:hypothetical protein
LVGKLFSISLAEWGRPAGYLAGVTHFFHEVTHGKALADIFLGEGLPPWVEDVCAFFDGFGGQRNVLGNHQIVFAHLVHNFVVCNVETVWDLPAADVWAWWQTDGVVSDEGGLDLPAGGGTAENFPDGNGAGIGVDPDWHFGFPSLVWLMVSLTFHGVGLLVWFRILAIRPLEVGWGDVEAMVHGMFRDGFQKTATSSSLSASLRPSMASEIFWKPSLNTPSGRGNNRLLRRKRYLEMNHANPGFFAGDNDNLGCVTIVCV